MEDGDGSIVISSFGRCDLLFTKRSPVHWCFESDPAGGDQKQRVLTRPAANPAGAYRGGLKGIGTDGNSNTSLYQRVKKPGNEVECAGDDLASL